MITNHPTTDGRWIPLDVQCEWRLLFHGTYICPQCKQVTSNLPALRSDVCPALDRRKGEADRRSGAR